ncbi:MAG TPA: TetR family transcriptional regulator [Rhizomicrobium sp.]|nr:TetR family transcriptional regulator [Rhizomicrobium sp.]
MPEAEAAAQSRLAKHSAVRSAVLDAGRRSAARDGVANLSLSSVAAEAALNPSTIFGLFRNKEDLVLAIIADDLSMLASAMRERLHPADPEPSPLVLAEDWAYPREGAENPKEDPRTNSLQAATLEGEITAHANLPVEHHTRRFQIAGEELESRLKQAEANAARAVTLSEESMRALFDRMETFERQHKDMLATLKQRAEEAERRQRSITSELRMAINDTATRVEILESARRDQAASAKARANTAPAMPPGATDETAAASSGGSEDAYRDAAERAASAAATLAGMQLLRTKLQSSKQRSWLRFRVSVQRRHWLIAACTFLSALVLGAFTAFMLGEAHGRNMQVVFQTVRPNAAEPSARTAAKPFRASVHREIHPQAMLGTLAEGGNRDAALLLGLNYLHGAGVTADQPKAALFIGRAAELGDPVAQYWLGNLYEHGDGVRSDPTAAVRWYEAAATHGNRKAMHALGVAYAQGHGTPQDYAEAARWFTKAAQLGVVNSQFNLGVLFERGLGVKQSLVNAYRWYALAAGQNDEESRARMEALKTQLNPTDLAEAERAAAEFRATAANPAANDTPQLAQLSPRHQ